jgi:lipoprotein-anchoring transpeptidase ErfK/SrfK
MRWLGVAAGTFALSLVGQASAMPPAETVSLTLPPDAFKLSHSVRMQAAGLSTTAREVSLELDLRRLPQNPPPEDFGVKRLRETLAPELAQNFDLFLYVSKAAHGPHAQHMYVLRKRPNGFELLHDWPVSTGRERVERNARGVIRFTSTLPGYYELDPERIFTDYRSATWDEAMPHAMFFDAWYKGARVGLAIHATDESDRLGSRASAGCVRLSPSNARELFQLVNEDYRGRVPRMAFDTRTQSTRRDGTLMRDADGKLKFHEGYRVLVIVEDFGGTQVATQ